jgi:DNA-binding transcriptional LysR family regulator
MDAWDFQVFAAVAREGGMTKAADALHTVQSNVTKRIRLLEDELGAMLFHRRKNGISLTSAGEQLLPYAEKMQRLLVEAKGAVVASAKPKGPLRIGAIETTVAMRLAPLFTRYSKLYPDVDLSVVSDTTGALISNVLDYKVEAAFVVGPVSHPMLASIPVCEEELVLYTPTGVEDVFRFIRTKTPRVLVFRVGCSYRDKAHSLFSQWGMSHVRLLEFSSLDGIFGCVSAGLGITLFPRGLSEQQIWRSRWRKTVALHPLPKKDGVVPTVFIRRQDAYVSAAMTRLIDLLPVVQSNGKVRLRG